MTNIQDTIGLEMTGSVESDGAMDSNAPENSGEALQSETSQSAQLKSPEAAFNSYCEDNPDADECRIYED